MKTRIIVASLIASAAVAASASADFVAGNLVGVNGSFGPGNGNDFGQFGTFVGQGAHALGGNSIYWDTNDQPFAYTVLVSSTVNDIHSVSFSLDFTNFAPAYYSVYHIEITGLKSDGSIAGVGGNATGFSVSQDGNTVMWDGTGATLASIGTLSFKIDQVPAPGALALLGCAGLVGARRRRA